MHNISLNVMLKFDYLLGIVQSKVMTLCGCKRAPFYCRCNRDLINEKANQIERKHIISNLKSMNAIMHRMAIRYAREWSISMEYYIEMKCFDKIMKCKRAKSMAFANLIIDCFANDQILASIYAIKAFQNYV